MMHDGAFHCIFYIYRVSAPSIPKISFLPLLEPTERISNTHTYSIIIYIQWEVVVLKMLNNIYLHY